MKRIGRVTRWGVVTAIALPFALGCSSSFHEHHFFRTHDELAEPVNYFRVEVRGSTLLSSSRYLSGYFDVAAVEAYFNEFSQPDEGQFLPDPSTPAEGQQDQMESLEERLRHRRLVLLLSSNADAIAEGIGDLAQSQQVGTALVLLANRDRLQEGRIATRDLESWQDRRAAILAVGDRSVAGLDPEQATAQQAEGALLRFLSALAIEMGGDHGFASFDEAAAWLRDNRARLVEGRP